MNPLLVVLGRWFVLAALVQVTLSQPVVAVNLEETDIAFGFESVGGLIDDNAIFDSAGRETQVYKMVNAILSVDLNPRTQDFSGRVELVLIGDEVYRDDNNAARVDYYKNVGADLLYYGDHPVRNAYITYHKPNAPVSYRFGRMVHIHGMDFETLPYHHRHDAPHAVFLDKEILNGVNINYDFSNIRLSGAVLNGRGRPNSDYNFYLNGQTDPNIKGNNTPVLALRAEYSPHEQFSVYASYHRNKTGSAPGVYGNGKYNDNRWAVGVRQSFYTPWPWLQQVDIWGQVHEYLIGLTESGVQGSVEGLNASKDLKKNGHFITLRFGFSPKWFLQYTQETLDRVDSRVWTDIADRDPDSPALNQKEKSDIWSVEYQVSPSVLFSLFYRALDNPFPQLSGISSDTAVDDPFKAGLLVKVEF